MRALRWGSLSPKRQAESLYKAIKRYDRWSDEELGIILVCVPVGGTGIYLHDNYWPDVHAFFVYILMTIVAMSLYVLMKKVRWDFLKKKV